MAIGAMMMVPFKGLTLLRMQCTLCTEYYTYPYPFSNMNVLMLHFRPFLGKTFSFASPFRSCSMCVHCKVKLHSRTERKGKRVSEWRSFPFYDAMMLSSFSKDFLYIFPLNVRSTTKPTPFVSLYLCLKTLHLFSAVEKVFFPVSV